MPLVPARSRGTQVTFSLVGVWSAERLHKDARMYWCLLSRTYCLIPKMVKSLFKFDKMIVSRKTDAELWDRAAGCCEDLPAFDPGYGVQMWSNFSVTFPSVWTSLRVVNDETSRLYILLLFTRHCRVVWGDKEWKMKPFQSKRWFRICFTVFFFLKGRQGS